MGLLAPRTDLVEVILNGKLRGVHAFVEQLEELTLRASRRMPGDMYAGELEAKDSYRGIYGKLFQYPKLWKKIATNNRYDDGSMKPLEELLSLINSEDSEENHQQLSDLMDMDAWGRFAAFELLARTFHYGDSHNWRLYYDPMKSRFFPVVWDPAAWLASWIDEDQLDIIPSLLHRKLYSNADFLKKRANALGQFFISGKDYQFLDKLRAKAPAIKRAAGRDPLITESIIDTLASIEQFGVNVERVFSEVRREYSREKGPLHYAVDKSMNPVLTIRLAVSGRVPITKLHLYFMNKVGNGVTAVISYSLDNEMEVRDITGGLAASGASLSLEQTLIANHLPSQVGEHRTFSNRLLVEPGVYDLALTGIEPSNGLIDVGVEFGDGEIASGERIAKIDQNSFSHLYKIIDSKPRVVPLVWSGDVEITGVIEIDRPLIILPGARIELSSGASILLRNRLLAEGTAEQPILFFGADANDEPWGSLALIGDRANGSKLAHVRLSGGSGYKNDLVEYSAMLSIHDVQDVEVLHALFKDSEVTDDMVHIVYSDVRFRHSIFQGSFMDSLDVDISDVVIESCHFVNSGNDSVDLMESNAVIIDTIIENAMDKAVSVGEQSYLLSINSIFRNNFVGIQAKDRSVVSLYNADLVSNRHALQANKKSWRYGDGGAIYVHKSFFKENGQSFAVDQHSQIHVFDTYLDDPVVQRQGVVLDANVNNLDERSPLTYGLSRHANEKEILKTFASVYWDLVNPRQRGSSLIVKH